MFLTVCNGAYGPKLQNTSHTLISCLPPFFLFCFPLGLIYENWKYEKNKKNYSDRPTGRFWELENDANRTFYRWPPMYVMCLCSLISIIHAQFSTPTSTKISKLSKLQTLQNKCVRFCLQLDNKAHVDNRIQKDILASCWLLCIFRQCLAANTFKFFDIDVPYTWETSLISLV